MKSEAAVVVIGAGPAGLAAAASLAREGVGRVVVIEREAMAGGVPRHCGHSPFGMREFGRVMDGPDYAVRLAEAARAAGAEILLRHDAVAVAPGGRVRIASPDGVVEILAERVVLATGARETPRAALLVPGDRPLGIMNTGALQAYAYLEHLAPFRRPVIVGTELIFCSAILTCRKVGAKPVAVVEAKARPGVNRVVATFPRLLGIPVHYGTEIVDIVGGARVERVVLRNADGATFDVACDGVVFTGGFVPETSLAVASGIAIRSDGLCSDPLVFAAGNVAPPLATAGRCWSDGRRIAAVIARGLAAGG